ncbi:hypothetical protein [Hansschlegelia plantiphila]|uniref:hypothetical protein n=1 Tax=Hansschlegelia plantiphila TaxID=374655 RepID=UPI0022F264A7|nr:hypothetical protein [Hansschlegelia plantiphila]
MAASDDGVAMTKLRDHGESVDFQFIETLPGGAPIHGVTGELAEIRGGLRSAGRAKAMR